MAFTLEGDGLKNNVAKLHYSSLQSNYRLFAVLFNEIFLLLSQRVSGGTLVQWSHRSFNRGIVGSEARWSSG